MSKEEFYNLVAQMRSKQQEYFKTRNANVLIESKELEKKVDREIQDYYESKNGGKLFDC